MFELPFFAFGFDPPYFPESVTKKQFFPILDNFLALWEKKFPLEIAQKIGKISQKIGEMSQKILLIIQKKEEKKCNIPLY